MADDFPWEDFQNRSLDPAAVRWAVAFIAGWFVAWTGFVLYSGNELGPTLMQGAASAAALGVLPISQNPALSVKQAASWTTSKEFEVRWFHFAFGCIVYNMWLLVDFLTQERIGVIETRKKPRIKLSRFTDWLENGLEEWLEEESSTLL
ncbi:hypothetical protein [Natrinema versiforme]|uniref:Transposase IS4 family protein n=1 Tax=Natrinema versiforme JCM 10478 TaxID=1227496 RepID=L9XP75_9EURY|nr:hypothetical protein [Natrinema versiforme]ELY63347.1 transposase IS4 family protein [Natrinema versiforme JCM 10478]